MSAPRTGLIVPAPLPYRVDIQLSAIRGCDRFGCVTHGLARTPPSLWRHNIRGPGSYAQPSPSHAAIHPASHHVQLIMHVVHIASSWIASRPCSVHPRTFTGNARSVCAWCSAAYICSRYHRSVRWASLTSSAHALCEQHEDVIVPRNMQYPFSTGAV